MTTSLSPSLRIGVSACLMGEPVRYDGRDKRDTWVAGTLARHAELVPVCPEVGIGLGVPRPPIRLEGDPARPRALGVEDKTLDVTQALQAFGRRTARALGSVSGFILKSRSPSCGAEGVKVYGAQGRVKPGRGLFARELMAALPLLPVEEDDCLVRPEVRDHFLERVFAYRRWQDCEAQGITVARLMQFHAAHKLVLMAHSPTHYRALGRLVADAQGKNIRAKAREYAQGFMQAMSVRPTPRKHANVLQHLMGYLKRQLDEDDKAELREVIDRYRTGRVPLIVPLTLLQHHFRRHPDPYVMQQIYLYPSDEEVQARFG